MLLIDPAKDRTLQAAIKSDRVMTLYQQSGGTDHGVVGFEQGRSRQFLVFPKSLKAFDGQRIVGIKYDLLEEAPVTEKEPAKKEPVKQADEIERESAPARKASESPKRADRHVPTVVTKAASARQKESSAAKAKTEESSKAAVEDKVVKFHNPEPVEEPAAERENINALKRKVREAMDALEQGKQIVAFNLLKGILDTDTNR